MQGVRAVIHDTGHKKTRRSGFFNKHP